MANSEIKHINLASIGTSGTTSGLPGRRKKSKKMMKKVLGKKGATVKAKGRKTARRSLPPRRP